MTAFEQRGRTVDGAPLEAVPTCRTCVEMRFCWWFAPVASREVHFTVGTSLLQTAEKKDTT